MTDADMANAEKASNQRHSAEEFLAGLGFYVKCIDPSITTGLWEVSWVTTSNGKNGVFTTGFSLEDLITFAREKGLEVEE
jgi:hypothetical protein